MTVRLNIFISVYNCDVNITLSFFFFFNDTATTEIYTLSLHDALPILVPVTFRRRAVVADGEREEVEHQVWRSEEHTSELQSPCNLVCRLLLEKKKKYSLRTVTAKRIASSIGLSTVMDTTLTVAQLKHM